MMARPMDTKAVKMYRAGMSAETHVNILSLFDTFKRLAVS